MTPDQKESLRRRLLDMRSELLAEMRRKNAQAASLIDEGVADYGDQALTDTLKEYLHLLSDSKRDTLLRIDAALDRLAADDYGTCLDCGQPIAFKRLEIEPQTRFCVDCRQRREEEEAMRGEPGTGKL